MESLLALSLTGLMGIALAAKADQTMTTITGDCSPVTMNSTINQPITVNCFQSNEERDLEALANAVLSSECNFRYPSNWTRMIDHINQDNLLVPPPGNSIGLYDFRFKYSILPPDIYRYIFLNAWDIDHLLESYDLDKEQAEKIKAASSYGPIYQQRDYDLAFGAKDVPSAVTRLTPLRSVAHFEDGLDIHSSALDVFIKDNQLWSSVFLDDYIDPYPEMSKAEDNSTQTYSFECTANLKMPSDLFARVCATLIEQTTLNQSFGNQQCYPTGEGTYTDVSPDEDSADDVTGRRAPM